MKDKIKFKVLDLMYKYRQRSYTLKSSRKIVILYYIPKSNKSKYESWVDGFTKGIKLLEDDFNITWINLYDKKPTAEELNNYDFLLFKSCWGWILDRYVRELKGLKIPRGIVVSCSKKPTGKKAMFFYDIVWFQTYWYKHLINRHPQKIHAFGINTEDFVPQKLDKDIDVLGVGALTSYKRFNKMIALPGQKKYVIGDANMDDSEQIKEELTSNGIKVLDYISQAELANYINRSKLVYLPPEIDGGGERAVLEARNCGVEVKVEPDNPKLQELQKSPIWDQFHYSNQIRKGIERYVKTEKEPFSSNRIESNNRIKVGKHSFHNGGFQARGDEYISIGSYCSFGKNVSILTSNHDTNYLSTQGYVYRKQFNSRHPGFIQDPPNKERTKGPVKIGNDVWIGDNVTILSGVTIGDGASIATGSVVVKDIGDYELHGGMPNKHIKNRFNSEVISFLKDLKWWYWSDKKIKANEKLFNLNLNSLSLEEIKKTINNEI